MDTGCTVCDGATEPWGTATILDGRHEAEYERCTSCGLVRAANVDWLDDAYAQAIADADVGLLDRCMVLSHATAGLLPALNRFRDQTYLDWGGGYGTLTRLMRDRGYNFVDYDPYARSIFGAAHRLTELPPRGDGRWPPFGAVTAFEVLEHLVDPVAELAEVTRLADMFIATTQPLPDPAPKPGEWDYYSLETGQHVTFYTRQALEILGQRLGFDYVASGPMLHVFKRHSPIGVSAGILTKRHQLAYLRGMLTSPVERRRRLD